VGPLPAGGAGLLGGCAERAHSRQQLPPLAAHPPSQHGHTGAGTEIEDAVRPVTSTGRPQPHAAGTPSADSATTTPRTSASDRLAAEWAGILTMWASLSDKQTNSHDTRA